MSSITKNLIEYEGISDTVSLAKHSKIFKQFMISKVLDIPTPKPDIEQLVKISIFDITTQSKIIKTPVGTSLEGVNLTGWKMIVNGTMNIRVQYVANVPEQSVHVAHYKIPFSSFVVIPAGISNIPNIFTNIYVEDIFTNQLDFRRIFTSITLLITLDY